MCKAGWFSAIHLQAWSCMFSDPAEWCNCQVEPIHSISPMARWQRLHFRASKKSICWTISCSWVGCSDATMELFGLHLLGQLVLIHRFVSPSLLISAVWRDLRPVTCIGFVIGSVKIILKLHGHSNPGLSGLRNASWLAVPNFPKLLRTRLFDHCLQWLGSPVGWQEGSILKANLILAHRACTGKLDCQRLPSFLELLQGRSHCDTHLIHCLCFRHQSRKAWHQHLLPIQCKEWHSKGFRLFRHVRPQDLGFPTVSFWSIPIDVDRQGKIRSPFRVNFRTVGHAWLEREITVRSTVTYDEAVYFISGVMPRWRQEHAFNHLQWPSLMGWERFGPKMHS